jgi:hypothetical protein
MKKVQYSNLRKNEVHVSYVCNSHFTDPLFEQTSIEHETGQSNTIIQLYNTILS